MGTRGAAEKFGGESGERAGGEREAGEGEDGREREGKAFSLAIGLELAGLTAGEVEEREEDTVVVARSFVGFLLVGLDEGD